MIKFAADEMIRSVPMGNCPFGVFIYRFDYAVKMIMQAAANKLRATIEVAMLRLRLIHVRACHTIRASAPTKVVSVMWLLFRVKIGSWPFLLMNSV